MKFSESEVMVVPNTTRRSIQEKQSKKVSVVGSLSQPPIKNCGSVVETPNRQKNKPIMQSFGPKSNSGSS